MALLAQVMYRPSWQAIGLRSQLVIMQYYLITIVNRFSNLFREETHCVDGLYYISI